MTEYSFTIYIIE